MLRAHYIRTRPTEYVAAFKKEFGEAEGLRMWQRFYAESKTPPQCRALLSIQQHRAKPEAAEGGFGRWC